MRSFLLGAEREGAFNVPFKVERGGGVPTARDYVQDGLIHMWDGKENAGWGVHDATTTTWKDLVGNRDISISSACNWGDDRLVGNDSAAWSRSYDPIEDTILTLEIGLVYLQNTVSSRLFVANYAGRYSKSAYAYIGGGKFFASDGESCAWSGDGVYSAVMNPGGAGVYKYYKEANELTMSSGDYWSVGNNLAIGRRYGNNAVGANAELLFVRLYSSALTAAEIAANYAVDKARFNLP